MTQKIETFIHTTSTSLSNKIKTAEFKLCAYICIHNLPLLLMDTLPELCTNIFTDSEVAQSLKLKRKRATQIINESLGPFCTKDLVDLINVEKIALIIDETTDISTNKSLILIVRFFYNYKVVDRILDLVDVHSSTAEDIYNNILSVFAVNKVSMENIIAFSADNASTMMGRSAGVQAKLKTKLPHLFSIGCTCHKLHLLTSAAIKKLPSNLEQFARDIYMHFAHSSKRMADLVQFQVFVQEKVHKMLKVSQTRWLSLIVSYLFLYIFFKYFLFQNVVERIIEHWSSLTLYFQNAAFEDSLPSSKSILNALRNPTYKLYFLFLKYILKLTTSLNEEFQAEDPKLPYLYDKITSLYAVVLKNFIKAELFPNTADFQHIDFLNIEYYLPVDQIYCGALCDSFLKDKNNNLSNDDIKSFKIHVRNCYIEIVSQILSRFDLKNEIIKYSRLFTPHNIKLKSLSPRSIAEFINFFPKIDIDIEEANIEWQLLLQQDLTNFSDNIILFWEEIFKLKNNLNQCMYPNLIIIVKTILTLPHSSASAERAFSQSNLNKTKIRNKLSTKTCSSILKIKDYFKLHNINDWKIN